MKRSLGNFAWAPLTLGLLTGCLGNSFDGALKVSSPFYAYVNGQTITVPAGIYDPASVTGKQFLFSKSISLNLPLRKGSVAIEIQVPGDLEIPDRGGKIRIPAATAQQPFDLTALFDAAVVTVGPEESTYEKCTYETCSPEQCDPNGSNCAPPSCTTWPGERFVRYHSERTVQHVSSSISSPNKAAVLATFKGTSDRTVEVNDEVGDCH